MALSMAVSTHTPSPLKPSCPFSLWASRSCSSSSSYGSTLHRLELERFHNDARPQKKNFFFSSSIQLKQNKSYISANQYADSTPCYEVDSSPLNYPSSRDRSYTNHQSFKRRTTLLQYYGSPRKNLFSREATGRVMGSLDRNSVEKFPQRQIPGDLIQPVLLKSSRENWVSSFRKKEDANVQTARPVITGLLTDTSHGKYEQAIPVLLDDTNDEFKHQKCESSRGLLIPNISNSVVTQLTKSTAPEKLHNLNGCSLEDLESSRVVSCSTSSTPGLGITKRSKNGPSTAKQVRCMKRKGTAKVSPSNNGSSSGIQVAVQKREELLALPKEGSRIEDSHVNGLSLATLVVEKENETLNGAVRNDLDEGTTDHLSDVEGQTESQKILRSNLCRIYDKVLVIDNIASAKRIVSLLTTKYRHLVHACDTEVSRIDVKQETPVDHGEITCFSIYSRESDFGNGKSCIWVDVLDGGGKDLLVEFAPFFEDPSIKKVWHNYSFDCHVVENYGIKLSGFHADTMHMARLWNSSRRLDGGYSLEALTSDPKIIPRDESSHENDVIGKVSMKSLFGRRKVKKDGSFGKLITIPPIEEIQREDRKPWICYSSLDSISTLRLYESMKCKLSTMPWSVDGKSKGSMVDFYNYYWRPFGELLIQMETEGMLVDRQYLAEVEKVAVSEQAAAAERFRSWASKYCPDARHMNVGSDTQLRQLFFGGIINSKNSDESLPEEKQFKIPNVDNVIEEGKKAPLKNRNITLRRISDKVIETELYTASGWPSVSGVALKALAGKVSADYDYSETCAPESDDELEVIVEVPSKDTTKSVYGTAYAAFGKGRKGKEACHAIASLCEVCSIDSLISNFILPLQGNHISGKHGRIHCSLNINTETGRLSARRPNLQNQPALEKDRYKIRQAFIASPGNSLIVADYGQLELRILAHLAGCKSMMDAFEAGGDFHSRTAMNMYPYIREAVEKKEVILEWHPQPGEEKPPVPLLKDAYGSERRKAKMLNFSIAYGKTPHGLAKDWKVSKKEAEKTVELWYNERKEVLQWQEERRKEAAHFQRVRTLLGRCRHFPSVAKVSSKQRGHIERAAINTPVQGSAADVAMCAMLEIAKNARLKELGWKLLLQVHDEVILEGPTESAEEAKGIVVECMSKPFNGVNFLKVDLAVDAKCAQNWYSAK